MYLIYLLAPTCPYNKINIYKLIKIYILADQWFTSPVPLHAEAAVAPLFFSSCCVAECYDRPPCLIFPGILATTYPRRPRRCLRFNPPYHQFQSVWASLVSNTSHRSNRRRRRPYQTISKRGSGFNFTAVKVKEQNVGWEILNRSSFLPLCPFQPTGKRRSTHFPVGSNRQRMIITNYLQDPSMSEIKSFLHLHSFKMYFTSPATPTNSCTFTSIRLFLHTIFEIVRFSFNGYSHSQHWRWYDKLILKNERNVLYTFWWGREVIVQSVELRGRYQGFKPLFLVLYYKAPGIELSLRRCVTDG